MTDWWLSPTPLKNDGVSSSVGMMKFPRYGKIIQMFQTTNNMKKYEYLTGAFYAGNFRE